jgi:hypothetical protein
VQYSTGGVSDKIFSVPAYCKSDRFDKDRSESLKKEVQMESFSFGRVVPLTLPLRVVCSSNGRLQFNWVTQIFSPCTDFPNSLLPPLAAEPQAGLAEKTSEGKAYAGVCDMA